MASAVKFMDKSTQLIIENYTKLTTMKKDNDELWINNANLTV